jgi:hypothetical protein
VPEDVFRAQCKCQPRICSFKARNSIAWQTLTVGAIYVHLGKQRELGTPGLGEGLDLSVASCKVMPIDNLQTEMTGDESTSPYALVVLFGMPWGKGGWHHDKQAAAFTPPSHIRYQCTIFTTLQN